MMPGWRNWQPHTLQVRTPQGLQVRLLSRAQILALTKIRN